MRSTKTLAFAFIVSAVLASAAPAQQEVQLGQQFTSPDGRFTAKYTLVGEGRYAEETIVIIDNKTGKTYPADPTISPVLSIKWMKDSRTLVKIVHIAEGDEAGVIHFSGGKWVHYAALPEYGNLDVAAYRLTRLAQKGHTLELAYAMSNKAIHSKDWIYSFTLDCDTGERSHEKTRKIDAKASGKLRFTEK